MKKKFKKYLSYANLIRKIGFRTPKGHKAFLDLYFRSDHFSYQRNLCNQLGLELITHKVRFNLGAVFSLAICTLETLLIDQKNSEYSFFEKAQKKHTSKILNRLACTGVTELHSLSFTSMKYIKLICKDQMNGAIKTSEYQHGLIYWDLFNVEDACPDNFVFASDDDLNSAMKRFAGTKWQSNCALVKSEIAKEYIYGPADTKPMDSFESWDGKSISFIHSPLPKNNTDISLAILNSVIEVAATYSIKLKIYPHPSSIRVLKIKYGDLVVDNGDPDYEDLIVGFFSSKLLKCSRSGYRTIQLIGDVSDSTYQKIPRLDLLRLKDLRNLCRQLKSIEDNNV